MKRIVFREEPPDFPDDVQRIIMACHDAGYAIDAATATRIWRQYSEDMAAGWMTVPSDVWIVKIVLRYGDVVEEA